MAGGPLLETGGILDARHHMIVPGNPPADDPLFAGPGGGLLRGNNFRRRFFDRAAASAGLSGVTPHDLRHTAASLALSAGANVKAVQRMLGHASAAMTLDVYAGLFGDDLDAVADRLDATGRAAAADQVRTTTARRTTMTAQPEFRYGPELRRCVVPPAGFEPATPA